MIEHPVSGERITFADDGVLDAWWPPGRARTPEHVHPKMEERWDVVAGHVIIKVGHETHAAGPGDTVVAPAGTPHVAFNGGDEEAHVRITMTPPLRWRAFVERLFAGEDPIGLLGEFPEEIAPPPR